MRLEHRIREGAERNASVLEPDVERCLVSVVRETRRRRLIRRTLSVLIAFPVAASAIALTPDLLKGWPASSVASKPPQFAAPSPLDPASDPTPANASTFTRTVPRGLAVVRANGLVGRWEIRTDARGGMRLSAPRAFGSSASWVFEVGEYELRTAAFVGSLCAGHPAGTYRWSIDSGFLLISFVSDPCDARLWLLTSAPWNGPPEDRQPITPSGPVRD